MPLLRDMQGVGYVQLRIWLRSISHGVLYFTQSWIDPVKNMVVQYDKALNLALKVKVKVKVKHSSFIALIEPDALSRNIAAKSDIVFKLKAVYFLIGKYENSSQGQMSKSDVMSPKVHHFCRLPRRTRFSSDISDCNCNCN